MDDAVEFFLVGERTSLRFLLRIGGEGRVAALRVVVHEVLVVQKLARVAHFTSDYIGPINQ